MLLTASCGGRDFHRLITPAVNRTVLFSGPGQAVEEAKPGQHCSGGTDVKFFDRAGELICASRSEAEFGRHEGQRPGRTDAGPQGPAGIAVEPGGQINGDHTMGWGSVSPGNDAADRHRHISTGRPDGPRAEEGIDHAGGVGQGLLPGFAWMPGETGQPNPRTLHNPQVGRRIAPEPISGSSQHHLHISPSTFQVAGNHESVSTVVPGADHYDQAFSGQRSNCSQNG